MKENMKIRGQLRTYLQWPIILSVFLLAANLAVGIVSPAAGLVMSGFTVIYVLVALWLFMYRRKRLMGGLVEFSAEADAMYAGIVIDTNNFMNQAGVRTFEAAAFLRRNGADVVRVRKLFRDRLEDYRARAEAIQKAEIYHGAFAISVCPSEGLESPTVVGAQAANELLDIVGIKASFILTQMGDTIYFSARSIDEINVQIIMERLGGGGHRTIAGAQLKGATIDEAREKLKDLITDMMEKGEI